MDSIQLLKKGRIGVCLRKTIVGVCFFLMAFVSNRLFAGSIANGLTLKNAGVTAPISIFKFTSAATQCAKSNLFTVYNGSNFKLGFTYTWDFGDGSTLQTSTAFTAATLPTDTAKNPLFAPSHSYISAGTYTIKLIVTNVSGTQATSSAVVTVAASPVVSFTASTSVAGTTNANIISFSSTSTLSSGNMSYAWSFGNLNATSLITSNPVDTFKAANGSALPVTLKVTNSIGGCASSLTKNITVYAPYKPTTPTVKFALNSVTDTQCLATNSYKFTNSSATGSDIKYKWSFGDTATVSYSEAVPPAHKYALPGVYTVTLTVSNTLGTAQTSTLAVTVAASPVVSFTASTSVAGTTNANIISFSSTSTLLSGNMSYAWNFGNTTATSFITSNPVDTFKAASGSALPVKLTVTNSIGGCASSLTKNITVYPAYVPTTLNPSLSLYYVADSQCLASNKYTFNYGLLNPDVKAVIDFGDGTPAYSGTQYGQLAPLTGGHTYAKPGVYTVKLTQTNLLNDSKTVTLSVTVAPNPVASFVYQSNTGNGENDSYSFSSTSTLSAGNLSYAWDFGDANDPNKLNTSKLSNPDHVFLTASYPYNVNNTLAYTTYIVKLTATSSIAGCSSAVTKTINVYPGTEGYSVVNKNILSQEALASSKVSISPNPASSTLKVSFVATTSKVNIKVVDLLGRVVKSVNQSANVGSNNTVQVDVSNLSSGTYVLKVSNEQGNTISSSQFVKLVK